MGEFSFTKQKGNWYIVGPPGNEGQEVTVDTKKGSKQVKLDKDTGKILYSINNDE